MIRVTDDERREVARRLRELVPCLFDDGEYIDCGEVEEALGLVNDDGAWYRADGVMRLADLIEPSEPQVKRELKYRSRCDELGAEMKRQRDALLKLADDLDYAGAAVENVAYIDQTFHESARRIREALGVSDG